MEQKYSEIRKPVYDKRNEIIKSIPDFWLTAVSNLFVFVYMREFVIYKLYYVQRFSWNWLFSCSLQFISHPALGELLSEEDQKVCMFFWHKTTVGFWQLLVLQIFFVIFKCEILLLLFGLIHLNYQSLWSIELFVCWGFISHHLCTFFPLDRYSGTWTLWKWRILKM